MRRDYKKLLWRIVIIATLLFIAYNLRDEGAVMDRCSQRGTVSTGEMDGRAGYANDVYGVETGLAGSESR
ncbi:MAG: hypothetical protein ABFD54_05855 [Armatimonadota bacterium]|nr:hypothetical protein [bacterium]